MPSCSSAIINGEKSGVSCPLSSMCSSGTVLKYRFRMWRELKIARAGPVPFEIIYHGNNGILQDRRCIVTRSGELSLSNSMNYFANLHPTLYGDEASSSSECSKGVYERAFDFRHDEFSISMPRGLVVRCRVRATSRTLFLIKMLKYIFMILFSFFFFYH